MIAGEPLGIKQAEAHRCNLCPERNGPSAPEKGTEAADNGCASI